MDLLDGLIAGYNCDGDTVDFTGITGDATAIGSTFTTPGKIFDQAALHDGIDDRWVIPTTGINRDDKAFSFGGWNNFSNAVGNFEHMMNCGAASASFTNKFNTYIRRQGDGKILFAIGKAQVWNALILSDDALLADSDTDFHVFATYDGSRTFDGMTLLFNGSEVTDFTELGSFGALADIYDDWLLGNEASLTFDMAGKQNQMLLYDKEVPAANISYMYNSGNGRVIPEAAGNINRKLGRGLNRGIGRGL